MKALVFRGSRRMDLVSIGDPQPGPGEVRLRTLLAGICGSEMHSFLGHSTYRAPGTVFGHEVVGVVDSCGDGVPTELVGRRFVADPVVSCGRCDACLAGKTNICASRRLLGAEVPGAFADYVVVPANNLLEVSPHLPDAVAVMAEPLANAVHVMRLLPSQLGRRLAILGCGPIGLSCLAVALSQGPSAIVIVDPVESRLEQARVLARMLNPGSDVLAQVPGQTPSAGFDSVLDAVGSRATRAAAIDMTYPGGTVLALGLSEQESALPMNLAIRKELTVRCSFAYVRDDFRTAIGLLNRWHEAFAPWIVVERLKDGGRAMSELADNPDRFVKIALEP